MSVVFEASHGRRLEVAVMVLSFVAVVVIGVSFVLGTAMKRPLLATYTALSPCYGFCPRLFYAEMVLEEPPLALRRRTVVVRACLAVAQVATLAVMPSFVGTFRDDQEVRSFVEGCVAMGMGAFYQVGAMIFLQRRDDDDKAQDDDPPLKTTPEGGSSPPPQQQQQLVVATTRAYLRAGVAWCLGLVGLYFLTFGALRDVRGPLVAAWYSVFLVCFLVPAPLVERRALRSGDTHLLRRFVQAVFGIYFVGLFYFAATWPLLYVFYIGILSSVALALQHLLAIIAAPTQGPSFFFKDTSVANATVCDDLDDIIAVKQLPADEGTDEESPSGKKIIKKKTHHCADATAKNDDIARGSLKA
mmetsp:Transcript_1079/g.3673  ORF Transcript_1079/g.3673 Transcript_1079/m.3673 type:complete len:358 (-) Transcript_1079:301-1374(-)